MSGAVIDTIKGENMVVHVIEDGDTFALTARYGRREGVIAHRSDKRTAKALARSVVACEALDGFPAWLASGDGFGDAF